MEHTPGYVAQGENKVYYLKKAIYDLKQSPRAWFEKFSRIVMGTRFRHCAVDHLVFIQQGISGCMILTVYVDDILMTGSDTDGITKTKEYLTKHFLPRI